MIRKSIAYCRVSSAKQSEQGYGMTRQQKLLMAYVEDYQDDKRLGYDLSIHKFQWMLQPGQSAFKGYNLEIGELHDFIEEAKTGKHKNVCLIIENIDRFSRATPSKSAFNFLALITNGVHIHEVETNIIYTEDLNLDQLSSSVMRANRESSRKAFLSNANWKNRYEEAVENNTVLTKRVPKWITVESNKYKLLPESNIIQYIFNQYVKGLGSTSIARELNDKNMFIADAKWYPQNVNRLLSDKRVCGWLVSTNKVREDVRLYPQIISDELFKQVGDIKSSKLPIVKHKPTASMNNLFNGISTCRVCGAAMGVVKQTHKGKVYTRLLCSNRKELKVCTAKSVRYDFIEAAVTSHIKNFDWAKFFSKNDNTTEIEKLKEKQLKDIRYRDEVKQMIDSLERPDISLFKAFNNIISVIEKTQNFISAMEGEPTTIDISSFDITNTEDRINYNLVLRKAVRKILIHNNQDFGHDFSIIEFEYNSSITTHIILMESLTGIVKSSISCTVKNNVHTYESKKMKVEFNILTSEVCISGVYELIDMAFMINFMEMIKTDKKVVQHLRELM